MSGSVKINHNTLHLTGQVSLGDYGRALKLYSQICMLLGRDGATIEEWQSFLIHEGFAIQEGKQPDDGSKV